MTFTIDISDELAAEWTAQAQAHGLTMDKWLMQLASQQSARISSAHLQTIDPQAWAHHFREWVNSHDPNSPVLSDDAMSRDSIYPDHV